jgi:Flp pilus assembly protein TadD
MANFFARLGRLVGFKKDETVTVFLTIRSPEEQNLVYKTGAELISPYIQLVDQDSLPVNTRSAREDLRKGIGYLAAVTAYAPENWSAHWLRGKGLQALNDHEGALAAFRSAYAIQKSHPDVAREFVAECLVLGRAKEAVPVAEHAVSISPDDAGLHANLALTYLLAGRISQSSAKIEEALRLDPKDPITRNLKTVISEVVDGKRLEPSRLSDLQR